MNRFTNYVKLQINTANFFEFLLKKQNETNQFPFTKFRKSESNLWITLLNRDLQIAPPLAQKYKLEFSKIANNNILILKFFLFISNCDFLNLLSKYFKKWRKVKNKTHKKWDFCSWVFAFSKKLQAFWLAFQLWFWVIENYWWCKVLQINCYFRQMLLLGL